MQLCRIEEGGQTDIESQKYVGEGEQGADRGRLLCQRMDGESSWRSNTHTSQPSRPTSKIQPGRADCCRSGAARLLAYSCEATSLCTLHRSLQ